MSLGIPGQLQAMEAEVDVGSSDSDPLFPIEEWMILDQAFKEGCRLGDRIFVVAGLWSEHGALQGAEVANTVSAAKLIDEQGVDSKHVDHT